MAQVFPGRWTAELEGDFVVFLIGMRVNRPWKVHKWWPVLRAMPRILTELEALRRADTVLLTTSSNVGSLLQYARGNRGVVDVT